MGKLVDYRELDLQIKEINLDLKADLPVYSYLRPVARTCITYEYWYWTEGTSYILCNRSQLEVKKKPRFHRGFYRCRLEIHQRQCSSRMAENGLFWAGYHTGIGKIIPSSNGLLPNRSFQSLNLRLFTRKNLSNSAFCFSKSRFFTNFSWSCSVEPEEQTAKVPKAIYPIRSFAFYRSALEFRKSRAFLVHQTFHKVIFREYQ